MFGLRMSLYALFDFALLLWNQFFWLNLFQRLRLDYFFLFLNCSSSFFASILSGYCHLLFCWNSREYMRFFSDRSTWLDKSWVFYIFYGVPWSVRLLLNLLGGLYFEDLNAKSEVFVWGGWGLLEWFFVGGFHPNLLNNWKNH